MVALSADEQLSQLTKLFDAASASLRLRVIRLLRSRGPLTYSEIMEAVGLDPSKDAGKFAYHLRTLAQAGLVELDQETRKYRLTELGALIYGFTQSLSEHLIRKSGKLLVRTSRHSLEVFDRRKIAKALVREAKVPPDLAEQIAEEAEERLIRSQITYLTAPLIREFVDAILIEKGLEEYRHKLTRLGLPVYEVARRIRLAASAEMDAEFVHKVAGDSVIRSYVFLEELPRSIGDAHFDGSIHLCNTGSWILKPADVVHDLRYFFGEGIPSDAVSPLAASYGPPKDFEEALLTTLKVLDIGRSEVAHEQVLFSANLFLAPYAVGVPRDRLFKLVKSFCSYLAQSPHSPCTLILDVYPPRELVQTPIPRGEGVYSDFLEEAWALLEAFVEAVRRDEASKPLFNPVVAIRITPEAFKQPEAVESLFRIHELARESGLPCFISSGNGEIASYTSLGVRFANDWTGDWELDAVRCAKLDSVDMNLPRIAFAAAGNDDSFLESLSDMLDTAAKALAIKQSIMKKRVEQKLLPMFAHEAGGEPYLRLENSVMHIGLVGLAEAVKQHTGFYPHESQEALAFAKKVLDYAVNHLAERFPQRRVVVGLSHSVEAAQRMAELDLERHGAAIASSLGTKKHPCYSLDPASYMGESPDVEKWASLSGFVQKLTPGGHFSAISTPLELEDLVALTKSVCLEGGVRFFAYGKLLTYCRNCGSVFRELVRKCASCRAASPLLWVGRISGRFLPLKWWPKSLREELRSRFKISA